MDNLELYAHLEGLTVQQVYDLLPINGYDRIMVDVVGLYKPVVHDKIANKKVLSTAQWDERILYVSVYDEQPRHKKRTKHKAQE